VAAVPLTLRDSLMARLDRFAPVKEIAADRRGDRPRILYELIAAVAPHARPSWTGLFHSSPFRGRRSSRERQQGLKWLIVLLG
jgi:hypothetical protein